MLWPSTCPRKCTSAKVCKCVCLAKAHSPPIGIYCVPTVHLACPSQGWGPRLPHEGAMGAPPGPPLPGLGTQAAPWGCHGGTSRPYSLVAEGSDHPIRVSWGAPPGLPLPGLGAQASLWECHGGHLQARLSWGWGLRRRHKGVTRAPPDLPFPGLGAQASLWECHGGTSRPASPGAKMESGCQPFPQADRLPCAWPSRVLGVPLLPLCLSSSLGKTRAAQTSWGSWWGRCVHPQVWASTLEMCGWWSSSPTCVWPCWGPWRRLHTRTCWRPTSGKRSRQKGGAPDGLSMGAASARACSATEQRPWLGPCKLVNTFQQDSWLSESLQ